MENYQIKEKNILTGVNSDQSTDLNSDSSCNTIRNVSERGEKILLRSPDPTENNTPMGDNDHSKKELEKLIKIPGPGGITFAKAIVRRKNAIQTAERFNNMETLTDNASEILRKATSIINDKVLLSYIDQQIEYRNLLGIKPTSSSVGKGQGKKDRFVQSNKEVIPSKIYTLDISNSLPSTSGSFDVTLDEEERKNLLLLTETKGPGGESFQIAYQKRKKALKNIKKFANVENLSKGGSSIFEKAKAIVEDKELENFIESQLVWRRKLQIAPATHEEQEILKAAKQARREQNTAAKKRKLTSDDLIPDNSKMQKQSSVGAHKITEKQNVDLNLRLVLVDRSNESGKISENNRLLVEEKVLDWLVESCDGTSLIFFKGGWATGYRIFDCPNEISVNFFKEAVRRLNYKDGNIEAIPWLEMNSLNSPKGWIWVPKPYMLADKLIKIIRIQNPKYNTEKWSIVAEGRQKQYGQHFLLKLCREDLDLLKENKMVIRVGLSSSTILMTDDDSVEVKEPEIDEVAESLVKDVDKRVLDTTTH